MVANKTAPKAPERKTETLSLRIDPKTRYGLELLSRIQRRSGTGVVEWAIGQALDRETVRDRVGNEWKLEQAMHRLWQVDELPRLLAMALEFPSLLTYEEQRMAAVLMATSDMWHDDRQKNFASFNFTPALTNWNKLKPMLQDAINKPTVQPLSETQLEELGYTIIPF